MRNWNWNQKYLTAPNLESNLWKEQAYQAGGWGLGVWGGSRDMQIIWIIWSGRTYEEHMGEVDTALFSFTHHVPITAYRTIDILILFYELRVVHKLCDHFWGGLERPPPPFMYQSKHFDITPWFWWLSKLLLYKKEFLTLLVKFLRCLMDSLYIVGNWCILDSCCYFCSWVSFPKEVLDWHWHFVLIEITEGTMSMLIKEEYH